MKITQVILCFVIPFLPATSAATEVNNCFIQLAARLPHVPLSAKVDADSGRLDMFLGHRARAGKNVVLTIEKHYPRPDGYIAPGTDYVVWAHEIVSFQISASDYEKSKRTRSILNPAQLAVTTSQRLAYGKLSPLYQVIESTAKEGRITLFNGFLEGNLNLQYKYGVEAPFLDLSLPIKCRLREVSISEMGLCMGKSPASFWSKCALL